MAALYDGDDNRVFTASRKEGKNTYQLSKASQRKASQVVSHHTQPQVGTNTPSSGMALVRMSSKPCLLYRKR